MDYKTMNIQDIISWCQANNEVAWLKSFANTKVEVKRYPRVKKEDGKLYADKSQQPTITMEKPNFITIKRAFVEKFMPEILPVASEPKKPTMYDLIDAL